ncbi:MAG: response regulator [Kofleriaceae bacterium]|nr:response regulator [Kofleriaceae bacterium]
MTNDPRLKSAATSSIRVLLIEDNPGDAILVQRMLKKDSQETYDVVHVVNLKETSVQDLSAIDVVLLDLSLPPNEGLDTFRRAKMMLGDLPTIVLTGLDDNNVAVAAVREGAQDYCIKNEIDSSMLVRIIRYSIERKRFENINYHIYHADRLASIGQLAAGVAHEINNPTAFLLTNLTLLQEHIGVLERAFDLLRNEAKTKFGGYERGYVNDLMTELGVAHSVAESKDMLIDNLVGIDRIRTISNDLKNFSRIERDDAEWIQLNEVANAACKMVFNEIRHRAHLVMNLGTLPTIAGDRSKLTQVLVNVLINAAHSIEEGATDKNTITLSTEYLSNKIVLTVQDTGCGISEEDQARVFEPFFTTKPRGVGTGLGLVLAAETIRKHRGTISITSELGQGTTFEMSIPTDTGLIAKQLLPETEETGETSTHRAKILIVDDELLLRKAFRRMLQGSHDISEAADGQEALALITANPTFFDVVLCDIMMPEFDGLKLYAALETIAPDLRDRVVFISGGAFTDRTSEFVSTTDALILEKPIAGKQLLEAVRSTYSKRRV